MSDINKDKTVPTELELQQQLRQTLNAMTERPDPLLEAALAATRAQIAARKSAKRHTSWWVAGGFAVAASLAVLVVMPVGQQGATGPAAVPTVATSAAMPDADLQLLEDMDMLAAMGNET